MKATTLKQTPLKKVKPAALTTTVTTPEELTNYLDEIAGEPDQIDRILKILELQAKELVGLKFSIFMTAVAVMFLYGIILISK